MPKKLSPEERLSVRVLVRLTPQQARQLREWRDLVEGLSGMSTFIRSILTGVLADP